MLEEKKDNRDESDNRISEALERAFGYLKDLTQQLNVVKPQFDRGYPLIGVPDFARLKWSAGNADFQKRPVAPNKQLFERITLNYRLSGDKQIQVTVDSPKNERLKQLLAENRIEYTVKDALNARGFVERSTFMFSCEVKASVMLQANFESGHIQLRTINVGHFGVLEHQIEPVAVTPEALEEFAGFILGEEQQFGMMLAKSAS